MEYLNGKNLQKKFLNEIKETVTLLGIKATLAVISIGDNKINDIFFRQIKNMCEYVGYEIEYHSYPDISENTLLNLIKQLNQNKKITSILLELPIPKHLSFHKVRNTILPEKDIEGINDINRMKYQNREGGFYSNTVLGIRMLLENYSIDINKKNIVIINRSETIGLPLFHFFLSHDCTITMCHHKTDNLSEYLKQADIVITATGDPQFLSGDIFKEDSIIIDIGVNYLNGKLSGDIDLSNENISKSKYIINSIGGVGPMTIAAISKSILKSYYLNQEDTENDKSLLLYQK